MKIFMTLIAILTLNTIVYANDTSTGCGAGWYVTKSMTTSAASTRASTNASSSAEFAMTTGTSGCERHSIVMQKEIQHHFLLSNQEILNLQIALGQGEELSVLAHTFGCQTDGHHEFAKSLQSELQNIFQDQLNTAGQVEKIQGIILRNKNLRSKCTQLNFQS